MNYPLNECGEFLAGKDGCCSANSGAPSVITAAAGLDNVEVQGQTVDRKSGSAIAYSAFICTGWLAALTNAKTLSLAHEYEDSADDSTYNTAVAIEAATVKQTATSSTNFRGVDEHNLDLTDLLRYFRINVTLDLSASATDTALFFTVVVLGGWSQVPQS